MRRLVVCAAQGQGRHRCCVQSSRQVWRRAHPAGHDRVLWVAGGIDAVPRSHPAGHRHHLDQICQLARQAVHWCPLSPLSPSISPQALHMCLSLSFPSPSLSLYKFTGSSLFFSPLSLAVSSKGRSSVHQTYVSLSLSSQFASK